MVHPVQNDFAKKMIEIIPCAEMVRMVTSGSDATAAAIRIARVFTKRDKVVRWGFRVALSGAQQYYNVIPDMACFSKAIANGYPISTVVGKQEIMEPSRETKLSATFFPNTFPMFAALATIREIQERDGIDHMWRLGETLFNGIDSLAAEYGIEAKMKSLPVIPALGFNYKDETLNKKAKDYFFSEMVARGILLHPNHHWFLSLAHTYRDVEDTLNTAEDSFSGLKKNIL